MGHHPLYAAPNASARVAATTPRTPARWRPPLLALTPPSATSRGARKNTIYLTQAGTQGDPSTYYTGNWTVHNQLSTASTPMTIAAAPGLPSRSDPGRWLQRGRDTRQRQPLPHDRRPDVPARLRRDPQPRRGPLTVSNSTFISNDRGIGGNGGAISNNCSDATLRVIDSTFTGNSAGVGGAIANGQDCPGATVTCRAPRSPTTPPPKVARSLTALVAQRHAVLSGLHVHPQLEHLDINGAGGAIAKAPAHGRRTRR